MSAYNSPASSLASQPEQGKQRLAKAFGKLLRRKRSSAPPSTDADPSFLLQLDSPAARSDSQANSEPFFSQPTSPRDAAAAAELKAQLDELVAAHADLGTRAKDLAAELQEARAESDALRATLAVAAASLTPSPSRSASAQEFSMGTTQSTGCIPSRFSTPSPKQRGAAAAEGDPPLAATVAGLEAELAAAEGRIVELQCSLEGAKAAKAVAVTAAVAREAEAERAGAERAAAVAQARELALRCAALEVCTQNLLSKVETTPEDGDLPPKPAETEGKKEALAAVDVNGDGDGGDTILAAVVDAAGQVKPASAASSRRKSSGNFVSFLLPKDHASPGGGAGVKARPRLGAPQRAPVQDRRGPGRLVLGAAQAAVKMTALVAVGAVGAAVGAAAGKAAVAVARRQGRV